MAKRASAGLRGGAAVLSLALALGGCAAPASHGRFVAAVPYSDAPLPAEAKIFLVAGGVDVANFAAEVAAQRRLWISRGFRPEEIACYWAAPTRDGFRGDRAQYRRLADELRGCYPASPAVLRAHLQLAAGRDLPFVYLYVTSHGLASLLPPDVPSDTIGGDERALLDQYTLQLGAGPGQGVDPARLVLARREGAADDDLLLSPRGLRRALQRFPAATPKLVVLQGCHAGGFLTSPRPADAIVDVPGLTALAAARHDRTSFGCDPGPDMTAFGAAYLRQLAARLRPGAPPQSLDWAGLFGALQAEVAAIERVSEATPSLPVYFSNAGGAPVALGGGP